MRLAHASPEELVIRKIFHILIQGNDQLSQDRVLTKFMGSGLISEATKQSMQVRSLFLIIRSYHSVYTEFTSSHSIPYKQPDATGT